MQRFLLAMLIILMITCSGICEVQNEKIALDEVQVCDLGLSGRGEVTYLSSEEDPTLLLAQIEDSGYMITYEYNDSKQCTAILQQYQNELISRHFYFYDGQGLLEKAIIDDGKGQQVDDLMGVTCRQMIRLEVGHQFPIMGKPLKIESVYWKPGFADEDGELIYQQLFHFDQEGNLISIEDGIGEIAIYFESFVNDSNFQESLLKLVNFDDQARLKPECFCDRVSINEIWDNIVDTFFSCFHYLQLSAHQTKMKWNAELKLPDPIAHALEKIGKTLFGNATYLLMGPHFEERRSTVMVSMKFTIKCA